MQPTTAIIYSSGIGGNTGDVSRHVADSLKADIFDLKKQTIINMSGYRRIIFGTGLQMGKPPGALTRFLEANREGLAGKKVSLFINCSCDEAKGAKQCEEVSRLLGIDDVVFFSSKSEKNEQGFDVKVDGFIDRRRE